jgi:hypothetical protein
MTVCIAALCDNGHALVVASDRMLSAPYLTLEFDHRDAKIDMIGPMCVTLSAGDALSVQDIVVGGVGVTAQLQHPTVQLIADNVRDRFAEVRKRKINELILRPRGLDFDAFYAGGMIRAVPQELAMVLDQQMLNFSLQTEILLAGIDDGGSHIYGIGDPGTMACFDRLGYHSIGSGQRHALLTLVSRAQHKSDDLNTTVFNVFAAKRAAELAQGVGQATDVVVIGPRGAHRLSPQEIDALDKILGEDVKPKKTTSDAIGKLSYGERQKDGEG